MEIASWFLVLAGTTALFVATLYLYLKRSFLYWEKRGFPYLEPRFPFGNLGDILTRKRGMGEAYAEVYRKMDGMAFGGAFLVHRPHFIVRNPEIIKDVLVKKFNHFHDHGFIFDEKIDPLTGNLFMMTGKKWKELRADLSPTFTSGKMKQMFNVLVACGNELKEFLKKYADREEVLEIKDVMSKYTTDIIASCAFGIECNCLKNPDAEFQRWGKRMLQLTISDAFVGMLYLLVPSLAIFLKLPLTPHCVATFFRKVVKETVEFREKNGIKRNDFMQLLIALKEEKQQRSGSGFTMDEITAQVMVFFTGGFETSSTTLSFCLYELALNPDIQDRLRAEIDSVLHRSYDSVTYEAIMEMRFLDKVVSETLRKYPPVTFLNRNCNKNYKIPETDLVIEKGIQVVIPVLGLHKDPKYFPDPEKFDPERFSEEAKNRRPNYVYLPFGGGPRVCIGMRFGLMQVKTGLVTLLSHYEFRTCDKTSIPLVMNPNQFIMTTSGGVWLQVSNRGDD